ncbi:NAD(P)H-dependent oxidoreductase subunit E [Streptomyces sp. NPDC048385]|uniref:NAD(P)H-dependent oxidoreductase subunit E n=1 Tax=Streptomyces TaxID=1883 RepID=UPI003435F890
MANELGVAPGTCSPDGAVPVQEVRCLGCCCTGPAALDGDVPCAGPGLAAQLAAGTARRRMGGGARDGRLCLARPIIEEFFNWLVALLGR